MELLIHLIKKGSMSCVTEAVKNRIEDLQKRNKLTKIADKSLAAKSQGFVSDVENRVTTETNVDLTKELKYKDMTDKCNSLFSSGSVNCRQFVEFEESDGCLYENSNYNYQYEK